MGEKKLKEPTQSFCTQNDLCQDSLQYMMPETWGDNSSPFSTWWMRSPLCPLNCVCSRLREREGAAPVHSLHAFLMEMTAHAQKRAQPAHTHTHCEVGTGQGCRPQRGRLTSENSLSSSGLLYITGGDYWWKSQGPRQFFSPPFQGKMPRAIKIASSNWMEKADVPHSGLREVRARRNAFRTALREM